MSTAHINQKHTQSKRYRRTQRTVTVDRVHTPAAHTRHKPSSRSHWLFTTVREGHRRHCSPGSRHNFLAAAAPAIHRMVVVPCVAPDHHTRSRAVAHRRRQDIHLGRQQRRMARHLLRSCRQDRRSRQDRHRRQIRRRRSHHQRSRRQQMVPHRREKSGNSPACIVPSASRSTRHGEDHHTCRAGREEGGENESMSRDTSLRAHAEYGHAVKWASEEK